MSLIPEFGVQIYITLKQKQIIFPTVTNTDSNSQMLFSYPMMCRQPHIHTDRQTEISLSRHAYKKAQKNQIKNLLLPSRQNFTKLFKTLKTVWS